MIDSGKVSERVLRALLASGLEEGKAREVAFHMSDCADDLKRLSDIWVDPGKYDDEQLSDELYKFLAHAPNHLAAAKKLVGLGPVEDIFKVGVLVEDEADLVE